MEETAILETTFTTDGGEVRLTDCFPVASEADKARSLWPEHQLLRLVECTAGEVEIEVVCDPRPDYGRPAPRLTDRGRFGFWHEAGREALTFRSDVPLAPRAASSAGGGVGAPADPRGDPGERSFFGVGGRERLRAGERRWLSLAYTDEDPAVVPPRDEEARASFSWILHSTRLTRAELQVLYDVHGETRVPERTLDHLEGYRGSRPVRVGNAARGGHLQLDVYGEVADAAFQYVHREGALSRSAGRMLVGLGEVVCRRWREPEDGIWEVRSARAHHTYSRRPGASGRSGVEEPGRHRGARIRRAGRGGLSRSRSPPSTSPATGSSATGTARRA